jgi:hypothetical protein
MNLKSRLNMCGLALAIVLAAAASLALATPAQAADPDGVSFNLDGCDLTQSGADPASYNPDANDLVCNDGAYVGGNLGKGWEELDLVPYRFTAKARSNAPDTQTYTMATVVDREKTGRPGYDVLSVPVLNDDKSDEDCADPSVGPEQILSPGLGGVDKSLYRKVTITQTAGTTCVYDYYARLAVGSHLFPGASLHANLANENLSTSGIGAEDRSVPVNEIAPQAIAKDMTATRDADHVWDIKKEPTPAELNFGDTCDPGADLEKPVSITVEWERLGATPNGDVKILTHVYATNPADRIVTVNVTDKVYEGTTQTTQVGEKSTPSGGVDVPKNTSNFLVLTQELTVDSDATHFNDVATASYTDKLTGVPIPGQSTAAAGADVQSGTTTDQSATITDLEDISGDAFSFSADGFDPAIGAFDLPYVQGAETTDPVGWTSDPQNGSGSVTFDKTVYADAPTISNGALTDTATVTESDTSAEAYADGTVTTSTDANVSLTIEKTIPDVLTGSESQTFTFHVNDPNADDGEEATETLTFNAGETQKSVTVEGLDPDTYTVSEDEETGWSPQDDQEVALNLPTCSGTAKFENTIPPAQAEAVKVTNPAGSEEGWEMILDGPGTPTDGEKVTTDSSGEAAFSTTLQEGSYTISETAQDGWDKTGEGGDCGFTVDYPADSGRTYTCTITNTQEGKIVVEKQTLPDGAEQAFAFDGPGDFDPSLTDGQSDSLDVDPGQYSVSETVPAGWDLTKIDCGDDADSSGTGNTATYNVAPGETVKCKFENSRLPELKVIKHVVNDNGGQASASNWDIRVKSGGSDVAGSPKTGSETGDTYTLPIGTYTVSETGGPNGYAFDGFSLDCAQDGSVTLGYGDVKECKLTNNDKPGTIVIVKNAKPQNGTFSFSTTGSSSGPGTSWPGNFTLTGSTSGGGNQKSFTVDAGAYTVTEGTQLSWILTGIGGSTDPNTPFDCTVTGLGGSTGAGDPRNDGALQTRKVSISVKNGDTVRCVFENTGNGATRTQGFWATHPQLADIAWDGGSAFGHTFPGVATVLGDKKLCLSGTPQSTPLTIDASPGAASGNSELMGGFWSDVSKTSTGKKRGSLSQAKMQLLQQLLAAELNASAFGSAPTIGTISAWETAFCGTNANAVKNAQQQAASFNSQGDSQTFTPGTSADSKFARRIANIAFWNYLN